MGQVRALFLTFEAHSGEHLQGGWSEGVDVLSFLSALVATARKDSKYARKRHAWPKWTKQYLRHLGKALWEKMQEHQLLAFFEGSDDNRNGLLEKTEFVKLMRILEMECNKTPGQRA